MSIRRGLCLTQQPTVWFIPRSASRLALPVPNDASWFFFRELKIVFGSVFRWKGGPRAQICVVRQVAVQLPMFNERAVCQAIIDSACEMHWPSDRFCVQVSNRGFLSAKVL